MESILTQLIYEHTLRIRGQADPSHLSANSPESSSDGTSKGDTQGKNIQGRINNLITTDMTAIAPGRDYLTVGASCYIRLSVQVDDMILTASTFKCCGHRLLWR